MRHVEVEGKRYARTSHFVRTFGVCGKTLFRWASLGKLPQPLRPFPNSVLWPVEETTAAIEAMKGGAA